MRAAATTRKRTITGALKQFDLIAGAGSESSKQACAMTLLAWVAGREWTDSPPCAHRLIRSRVIGVNDASGTTKAMRAAIVKAGATGILDTWWVPDRVVAWAFSHPQGEKQGTAYAELLRALGRIAAWKGDKGLPPVLSGAVLSGADLRRAVLSDAVLSDAVLSGADLSGADLRRAVLRRADLRRAVLSDAVLSGADLSGADLSGAVLSGADLSGAVLSGAVLSDADLSDAVLSGAVLSDAVLSGADLSGAVLSGADLRRAVLSDADLRRAVLSGADLRRAVLSDAVLSGARGTPYSGMPDGWTLNDAGVWVKS